MAEIVGLLASTASLISLAHETCKLCNNLRKDIACFRNAPAEVSRLSSELLDLAQLLDLISCVLQPLHDRKAVDEVHISVVHVTLSGLKEDICRVSESIQPLPTKRSTKGRIKWVYRKEEVAASMVAIDRHKQSLLTKLSVIYLKLADLGLMSSETSYAGLDRLGSRMEDLISLFGTSSTESTSASQTHLDASVLRLQDSIKEDFHQALSSIREEQNRTRASIHNLADLVHEKMSSNVDALACHDRVFDIVELHHSPENASSSSRLLQCTERQGVTMKAKTVKGMNEDEQSRLANPTTERKIMTRISIKNVNTLFGTLVIRQYNIKVLLLNSDSEFMLERTKYELDFFSAPWLRSWTGCGIVLARIGYGQPHVEFSLALPRIVDHNSPAHAQTWKTVMTGDINSLKKLLQSKIAHPTDTNIYGIPLLSIAANWRRLDICELLLQQGAGIGINTPTFDMKFYPLEDAIEGSISSGNRDFVRLFLTHEADSTLVDGTGKPTATWALHIGDCATNRTRETESLFRFLIKDDPSFDIAQMDNRGRTLLMQAHGQTLETYKELLKLGADAKAVDSYQFSVLHHFIANSIGAQGTLNCPRTILEGGEILALLIQEGADPQGVNSRGELPPEVSIESYHPLRFIISDLNLALWHQALRICRLDGPQYCACHSHRPVRHRGCNCLSKRPTSSGTFKFATFEEEMISVLKRWDRRSAEVNSDAHTECWRAHMYDLWEDVIQELLWELEARLEEMFPSTDDCSEGTTDECTKDAEIAELQSRVDRLEQRLEEMASRMSV